MNVEEFFWELSGLLHEHRIDVSDIHFSIKVDSPKAAAAVEMMFSKWWCEHRHPPWKWPQAFQMQGIKLEFVLDWRDGRNRLINDLFANEIWVARRNGIFLGLCTHEQEAIRLVQSEVARNNPEPSIAHYALVREIAK